MSEPGARLVLTHGLVFNPRFTAFRASSPAPIITLGFDVFVQLVMAATTTDPCASSSNPGGTASAVATALVFVADSAAVCDDAVFALRSANMASSACSNLRFDCRSETRSCGRFGPARLGSTGDNLTSMVSVYAGCIESALRN